MNTFFKTLFSKQNQLLTWLRLQDDHIVTDGTVNKGAGIPLEAHEAYYVIRVSEMYLKTVRNLWQKYYPMLHGFVEESNQEEHSVAGPGQLKALGEANLDRIVNLNFRLAGPTVYKGGDVSVTTGLYSIPGEDAAKALIGAVGSLASLAGVAMGNAQQITELVKSGVESVLGLKDSKLQLGVRDSFFPDGANVRGNPIRASYYVAINAPSTQIDHSVLWLVDGHLVKGSDPIAARPYQEHDYFVLQIEHRTRRDDWAGLPGMAEQQDKFATVLKDATLSNDEKKEKIRNLWPGFVTFVMDTPHLTRTDKELVKNGVLADLRSRLIQDDPFEFRSVSNDTLESVSTEGFDFLAVANKMTLIDAKELKAYGDGIPKDLFGR